MTSVRFHRHRRNRCRSRTVTSVRFHRHRRNRCRSRTMTSVRFHRHRRNRCRSRTVTSVRFHRHRRNRCRSRTMMSAPVSPAVRTCVRFHRHRRNRSRRESAAGGDSGNFRFPSESNNKKTAHRTGSRFLLSAESECHFGVLLGSFGQVLPEGHGIVPFLSFSRHFA